MLKSFSLIKSQEYYELQPEKFNQSEVWNVDATDTNDIFTSYSLFWYKKFANCMKIDLKQEKFVGQIMQETILSINILKTTFHGFIGVPNGKFLNLTDLNNNTICPEEKYLKFDYTDYQNVIVLIGGDKRSDVMILSSESSQMTFDERMTLVKNITDINFKLLRRPDIVDCPSKAELMKFYNIKRLKCGKLTKQRRREELAEEVFRNIPLILALAGVSLMITYGVLQINNCRKRVVIVPFVVNT